MTSSPYGSQIRWMSEEQYQKVVGQFRLQLSGVFNPFHGYGHDIFIPPAVAEVVQLTEDFGLRVRGVEKIISLEDIRRKR